MLATCGFVVWDMCCCDVSVRWQCVCLGGGGDVAERGMIH